jgi:predicted AAA+ superfamily ATPase
LSLYWKGNRYFFDPGITHILAGTETLDRNSNLYGKSFEQFICMELRAYLGYRRKRLPLTYWRSKNGHEVDFLLGTRTAIEVKATRKISRNDFKGLKYLKEEGVFKNFILVSQDPVSTLTDNILTIPWQKFLSDLWQDKFI